MLEEEAILMSGIVITGYKLIEDEFLLTQSLIT